MRIPKIRASHVDALVRRDTYENWQKVNPVLEYDELSYVTDRDMFALGDGFTPWIWLPKYRPESEDGSDV